MKIIILTSVHTRISPIRVNIEMIGDYYQYTENDYGKTKTYTNVGVLTNNNGGLQVKETPEEIDILIQQAK